jgi:hypothetical protein
MQVRRLGFYSFPWFLSFVMFFTGTGVAIWYIRDQMANPDPYKQVRVCVVLIFAMLTYSHTLTCTHTHTHSRGPCPCPHSTPLAPRATSGTLYTLSVVLSIYIHYLHLYTHLHPIHIDVYSLCTKTLSISELNRPKRDWDVEDSAHAKVVDPYDGFHRPDVTPKKE